VLGGMLAAPRLTGRAEARRRGVIRPLGGRPGAPRVLILSADIGAGHDLPARLLADGVRARRPDAEVVVADGLVAMGPLVRVGMRSGAETILERLRPLWDLQYWLVARFPPTRRLARAVLCALGGPGLLRLARAARPDVIVSTYPGTTEVLGRLRGNGSLGAPCVSAITDLAALRYWAHPGIDRHLIIHAESRAEVMAVAGQRADVRHVRGLSRPEFDDPPEPARARVALGLPPAGPVVVVSGGGWGIGDLETATRVVLSLPGAHAVCLCGSNASRVARLRSAFAAEPRVRVEGFTDRMCEWLAAGDALVHTTAGLTVLAAQICGTWAVSFGWGVAHVRVNNRAYRRFGLADVAATPDELRAVLRARLATRRPVDRSFGALPTAADAVLELVAHPAPLPAA
jgi:processive 1,2-diacylglycerol beta-glucosyltransferase